MFEQKSAKDLTIGAAIIMGGLTLSTFSTAFGLAYFDYISMTAFSVGAVAGFASSGAAAVGYGFYSGFFKPCNNKNDLNKSDLENSTNVDPIYIKLEHA